MWKQIVVAVLLALCCWWVWTGFGGNAEAPVLTPVASPEEPSDPEREPSMELAGKDERSAAVREIANAVEPEAAKDQVERAQGIVEDPLGNPLPDVEVTWRARKGIPEIARTNAKGEFELAAWRGRVPIATKAGYVTQYHTEMAKDESGNWDLVTIRMAATASLRVQVLGSKGKGVSDELVFVFLEEEEVEWSLPRGKRGGKWDRQFQAKTDEEGVAVLPDLPAGQKLRMAAGEFGFSTLRQDGQVIPWQGGGLPLLLAPGESRQLLIHMGPTATIQGVVREPNGRPSKKASVWIRTFRDLEGRDSDWFGSMRTDDEGRFSIDGRQGGDINHYLVGVYSREGEEPSYSPFGGPKRLDPLPAGWVVVTRPDESIDITMSIMPALHGKVVDEEGNPVGARIRAEPQQENWLETQLLSMSTKTRTCREDGAFRYPAVPPGLYDMYVEPHKGQATWVRDVLAGPEPVELVVKKGGAAHCKVSVTCVEDLDQVVLLRGRFLPFGLEFSSAPLLAETLSLSGPGGWPDPLTSLWVGGSNTQNEVGNMRFGLSAIEGADVEFELSPGWYWLGAKASVAQGGVTYPIGTGLVRIDPGQYDLKLDLPLSGSVEGRLLNYDPDSSWSAAIATSSGALLPVKGSRDDRVEIHPLPSNGRFRFPRLPASPLVLWFGPAGDLEAGRPRVAHRLTVEHDLWHEVLLEL